MPSAAFGISTEVLRRSDNGSGNLDLLGVAVYANASKGGGLWFSSKWDGAKTATQTLGGGNLVVH